MRRRITTIFVVAGLALGPAAVAAAEPVSPDARDANLAAQQRASTPIDLRSPDTRDAATGVRIPSVTVTPVETVSASDGFQWGDAGIGAGAIAAVVLVGLGTGVFVQRHHRGLAH